MKRANNVIKVISLLVVAMLCMALLVACGNKGDNAVSEIFVQKADMPRLTYVKGQEFNRNDGVLTAVINGVASPVPMNSAEVSVSGYDKDKLGKQTITITYKGKTTTIEVNVVERAVAEGFRTDYFVNDAFDSSKGKLRITKDDGSVIAVNLSSGEVTVKSFDSSKSGKATVTVVYAGEETIECAFDVNVHDVAKITLTTPKKTKYVSHETELALNGGYITVEAANVAGMSMPIPLTAEMITGYDPSVVTYENRDQVVTQTLTVTYCGLTASFDVQIAYSNVHMVQYMAEALSHLDWTAAELSELTETEKDNAIAGIEAYMSLTPQEKELITEEQRNSVLFPAVLALRSRYLAELETYGDAFGITSDGYLNIVGKSPEAVATAMERLQNPADPLNVYAELQLQIGEELGDTRFREGVIKQFMIAHSQQTVESLVTLFDFMLDVHNYLSEVPADWTVDTLGEYEVTFSNVVSKIMFSEFRGTDNAYLYHMMSKWREKDDMSELIFSYYYFVKENGREEIKTKLWSSIPMPGALNTWYSNFMAAYSQEEFLITYANSQAYLYDTAGFMYYYFKAAEAAKQIQESGDELMKGIYEIVDGDTYMERYLTNGSCGYLYHMGAGLDSAAVQDAWAKYMTLIDIYLNDRTGTYSQYENEFRACFDMLVDMNAMDLHLFLSSVNFLYEASRGGILVLDCTVRNYSTLTGLLYNYYANVLTEEMMPIYCDLLLALESYSLRSMKDTALADFEAYVEKIKTAYGALGEADRTTFDTYLGNAYSKCLTLYTRVKASEPVNVGTWEAKLQELLDLLEKSDEIIGRATSDEVTPEEQSRILSVYFAVVEKADKLYQELVKAGADVELELQARTFVVQDYQFTLDYYFTIVKRLFVQFMMRTVIQTDTGAKYAVWSMYHDSDVRPLLAQMADLLVAQYENTVYTGEDIYQIMAGFRALSPEEKQTFFILGVNQMYYAAVETYFGSRVSGGADLIRALIYAEINHSVHMYTNTDESLAAFTTKVEEMKALYEALEDKASFDTCLGEMYNLYMSKYNELKTQE